MPKAHDILKYHAEQIRGVAEDIEIDRPLSLAELDGALIVLGYAVAAIERIKQESNES